MDLLNLSLMLRYKLQSLPAPSTLVTISRSWWRSEGNPLRTPRENLGSNWWIEGPGPNLRHPDRRRLVVRPLVPKNPEPIERMRQGGGGRNEEYILKFIATACSSVDHAYVSLGGFPHLSPRPSTLNDPEMMLVIQPAAGLKAL